MRTSGFILASAVAPYEQRLGDNTGSRACDSRALYPRTEKPFWSSPSMTSSLRSSSGISAAHFLAISKPLWWICAARYGESSRNLYAVCIAETNPETSPVETTHGGLSSSSGSAAASTAGGPVSPSASPSSAASSPAAPAPASCSSSVTSSPASILRCRSFFFSSSIRRLSASAAACASWRAAASARLASACNRYSSAASSPS
mmetsp:Transcript_8778/g.21357  ORF Transcript_8778/g.21357 Transcript_8778/m.21357 type:complete len:203 (+) Transcript_8778:416-1024(+)